MNEFILKNLLTNYSGEVCCLESVDSTNNYASERANAGLECIVTAERQTEGRGRRGRMFTSEPGGLYMSLSVKVPGTPFEVMHYPILAALAVSNAIESTCNVKADIKWPNDIQINGKKVCGILTEMVTLGEDCYLVTGVGINVANEIPAELPNAGNLRTLAGGEPEMEVLAAAVANQIMIIYKNGVSSRDTLLAQAQDKCITIGRTVTAMSTGVTGLAMGMDYEGSLILKLPDGTTKNVIFGDVTVMK